MSAIACPNKNSKEWQYLVNELGEDFAYRVFMTNNDELPAMEELSAIVQKMREPDQRFIPEIDKRQTANELVKIFKSVGITVDVQEDKDIATDAEVENLSPTQSRITLRSLNQHEALEHEFSHIYLDFLGIDHPLLLKLWDQAQKDEKDIINHVQKYYPDLDIGTDEYKMEVMAHIVGREASQITPHKLSKIQIILNQIYRFVSNLFGKEPVWGKELAKRMMSGEFNAQPTPLKTGSVQFYKVERPIKPEEFSQKILLGLNERIKVLSKKVSETKSGKGTLQIYQNVLEQLQVANDVARFTILNRFITEQINAINKRLLTANTLDDAFFSESMSFVQIYSDIDLIEDFEGTKYEDVVNKLAYNSAEIRKLSNQLVSKAKGYLVTKYGKISTNPKIVADFEKIMEPEKDISVLSRWFNPLYETTQLFQLVDKHFKQVMDEASLNSQKWKEEFDELFQELRLKGLDNFNWLHELDKDTSGEKTGRYINEFRYAFYEKLKEYDDLIDAYSGSDDPEHIKIVDKAQEDKRKFLRENTHQPYTKEYYDIYKILDRVPEARDRRDSITKALNKIKAKAKITSSEFDPDLLTPEDYDQYIRLMDERVALSDFIDPDTGLPKVGRDKEIAELIREFNEKITEVFDKNLPKAKVDEFNQAKERARARGEEYFQKWKTMNTIYKIKDEWYKEREEAFKLLEGGKKSEISDINAQIDELVKDYKTKGGFIRADLIAKRNPDLFKKVQALERKKEAIMKEKAKNSSKFVRAFDIPSFLTVKGTNEYYEEMEKARNMLTPNAKRMKDKFRNKINSILSKYVNKSKTINAYEVSYDDLVALLDAKNEYALASGRGRKLKELNKDQLSLRHYAERIKEISAFVDTDELEAKFREDQRRAGLKGADYLDAWDQWFGGDFDTFIDPITGHFESVVLSGYKVLVPKQEYIDEKKTKALDILNRLSARVDSPDYEKAFEEAAAKGDEYYEHWFAENHVYDPISQTFQPLRIWMQTVPKDEKYIDSEAPTYNWQEDAIMDQYKNPNFEANIDPKTGYGKPLDKWKSTAYKKLIGLSNDDPRKKFYNWFKDKMDNITQDIASSILDIGFYPVMYSGKQKGLKETINDLPNKIWRTHISEYDRFELARGLKLRIPFVQKLQESYITKEDKPEDKLKKLKSNREYHRIHTSYDVAKIIDSFIPSILAYKAKNSLEDELFLAEQVFLSYGELESRSGLKKLISNKVKQAIGENAQDEHPIYVVNEESQAYARFKDWLSMVFYEEGLVPWRSGPNKNGFVIDGTKIARALQTYTQYKALAFNLYAGVSNITLGEVQLKMESMGKQFFSNYNLRDGAKMLFTDLPLLMNDIFSSKKRSMAGKIMAMYSWERGEAGDESIVDRYGRINKRGVAQNSVMFIQRAGDFMLQAKLVFAMLSSHTLKDGKIVRITEKGKEKSLLDTYREMQHKDPNVKPSELISKLNISPDEYSAFKQKIKFLFDRLNGIYDIKDRAAIQKMALGSMAMMFRKWIIPGFQRRWGKKKYYENAQAQSWGYYLATWDFLMRFVKDLKKLRTGLIMNEWETLPDYQKAAVRATLTETAILLMMIFALMLFLNHDKDDPEPESYVNGFLRFQVERLRADLLFFRPTGFITGDVWKIIRSPLVTMTTIEDATNLLTSAMAFPFQSHQEAVYQTGPNKGRYKVIKDFDDMLPIVAQVNRLKNPQQIADFYRMFK